MNSFSYGVSPGLQLLGVLLLGATAVLSWRVWTWTGRRPWVGFLECVRFLLVAMLVLTLARPEVVRRLERTERPEVVILEDASGSMRTRDVVQSNTVIPRAEWMRQQFERQYWKPLEQTSKVTRESFARPSERTNAAGSKAVEGTDLHGAVEAVLQRQNHLRALLILSDGDWNQGSSPIGAATRFREQEIPIFTVAVGRETPIPDVVLESVAMPSFGLLGEQIALPFRVRNFLPRELKTVVTLQEGTRTEGQREVVVPPLGEVQEAITWSPRDVGDATLKLSVPTEAEEILLENNQTTFRMNIRVETLKVLVVDSQPRWEYRFLRNALARDPGVELKSMLFHPGIGIGGGRNYLPAFPKTKEAISSFDVVFLGDVGLGDGELAAADLELIKGLVEQQGSGLVFLPGRRGRQLTLTNSALAELLPIVWDGKRSEGMPLQNEATLALTTVGRRHWLTRFDADERQNEELWKVLPGFFWSAAVEKSRPGSEVIGVHSAQRNAWGRMPLLVTRPAGSGQVLFMGTDSAWRWRRGVEDKYHYRFWSQVVRWMAHKRHLAQKEGVRLTYTPEAPSVGDTLFLQATVLDASGYPVEEGPVLGKVTSPSGRVEQLPFIGLEGGWGVFKSSFAPVEGGAYRVEVSSAQHGRRLEALIEVVQPVVEKEGQPVNADVLREMAGLTRGAAVSAAQLDEVIQKISLLPEPKPVERRIRLWSNPWWGGAILFLLAIYWSGRKWAGLM